MSGFKKNLKKPEFKGKMVIFSLILVLPLIFTTCDSSMGLGPPVDTIPPEISITYPQDGAYMRGILLGMPITLMGKVSDDMGVVSLQFEIFDRTNNIPKVTPERLEYEILPDGAWWAEIFLDNPGTADYRITVSALDKFKNRGAALVDIRIDIIPPWVKEKKIIRHPNGFRFEADLFDREHYRNLNIIEGSGSYNDIMYANLDQFQNEAFTVKIQIDPAFSDVAASRLFVYDANENLLNEDGLVPDNGVVREPEWTITKSMMEGWHSKFVTGEHYIYFEVWAWSDAAWDKVLQEPIEGEAEQVQRIDGTCWFTESDLPHIYINTGEIFGNTITLEPSKPNALTVEFYDDDRLGEIYAGLLTESDFDTLRGNVVEENYLRSLLTDETERNKAIAMITSKAIDGDPEKESRFDTISLTTGVAGEYRLIALAKDAKPSGQNYSFTDGEKWNVYPYRRILVQSATAPVIIVENPPSENQFPDLRPTGESFILSGYAISPSKNNYIQVAWIPNATPELSVSDAQTALRAAQATYNLAAGSSRTFDNGIVVWNLAIGEPSDIVLNGTNYLKTDFSKGFSVVSDFLAQGKESKRLVIHSNNGNDAFKTFRLAQWLTGPAIEVMSHGLGAVHDKNTELVLSMRVNPGEKGIKINTSSIKISDITDAQENENENLFSGATAIVNDEWQRKVPADKVTAFSEGTLRTYRFYAEDILGNSTTFERSITMSNLPVLQSITCTDGSGSYGIGHTLRFEASFTMPVRVSDTGSLRLKLFTSDPGNDANATTNLYAAHQPTAAGNTIVFTYTVLENDYAEKLFTSLNPLDLLDGVSLTPTSDVNGSSIITFSNHIGSLQNNADVKIDGVRPKVLRASFVQVGENANGGATYFTNGKTVTLKLTMSEPVLVTGAPVAKITGTTMSAEFSSFDPVDPSILYFTTPQVNLGTNIPSSQLRWGPAATSQSTADFIATAANAPLSLSTADTITDTLGNLINLNDLPDNNNRQGNASGGYPSERAFIDTQPPAAPAISIHPTQQNAQNNQNPIAGSVLTNVPVYLGVAGIETNAIVQWSLKGGSNPEAYLSTDSKIKDENYDDRDKSSYKPSEHSVTAWQTDIAGNRSPIAAARSVTINSRAPELRDINIALPDGVYPAGSDVTFRLNFSGKVRPAAGAAVTLVIAGRAANPIGSPATIDVPLAAASAFDSVLNVDWQVPQGIRIKDIKATSVTFTGTGVSDEYGNTLVNYSGNGAETVSLRPITDASTFQINQPNVEINSVGPRLMSANPVLPSTGADFNGGVISGNSFTLTFDVPVTKAAGKYITVRPYGQWAIPLVLSPADFQSIYNAATSEEHKKRLKNVDVYGVPFSDSWRGNTNAYNSYIETTHGITSIGGNVRPDTSAKWVLAFDIDPYQTENNDRTAKIREVFNAAGWKQQRISVSSNKVTTSGQTVTVTLNENLLPGRIWEVLLEPGAFLDTAGNPAAAITSSSQNESGGNGYRFWSAGTASPVIRMDRITYDGRVNYTLPANAARRQANIDLGFIDASNVQQIPPIDTKVRIDCETPGASIRYNVIRTRFLPAAAASGATGGYNNLLVTTTLTTDANFFGNNLQINTAGTAGYQRNTIGTYDLTAVDGNGFFNTLLTPNESQTGAVTDTVLYNNNGTFPVNSMTTLQNGLRTDNNLGTGGRQYRTVATNGTATLNTPGANNFIFIGDAYSENGTTFNSNIASAHSDTSLYSGRRDYIVAAAQKPSVTTAGDFTGPALNVSTNSAPYASMEGLYKTTIIYRNPGSADANGSTQLVLDGRTEVLFNGNPIPGFGMDDIPPSATDRYESIAYKTFYRVGANVAPANTVGRDDNTNNHILVSWEIVADIKRNRPAFYRNGVSAWGADFRSATYGGVSYRYHEGF